ncbi:hypothetical protein BdWA1_001094 [Babesia duncani]|uniref:Uncharacterized protein n=1 Tax=Babesia duncani TaxID=323732 RepID=A0AAD9PNE0_9APIC|nr:hypothetical protein BdWA1_001094 [Babesia duncani]
MVTNAEDNMDEEYEESPNENSDGNESSYSDDSLDILHERRHKNESAAPTLARNVTKAARLADLESKWELCIFHFAIKSSPSELSAFLQIRRCNTVIGTTRRYVTNHDCLFFLLLLILHAGASLLYAISTKYQGNEEFVKSLFTMVIRWWFCWRFNVFLTQFPHLGNSAILKNVTIGLCGNVVNAIKFLALLLTHHDELTRIITDMLVYDDGQEKKSVVCVTSCNEQLIEMLPIFKSLSNPQEPYESICYQACKFINELLGPSLDVSFDGWHNTDLTEEMMDSLWNIILGAYNVLKKGTCNCKCHARIISMALEIMASQLLSRDDLQTNPPGVYLKFVGFFVKWILVKDPGYVFDVDKFNNSLDDIEKARIDAFFKECIAANDIHFIPSALIKNDETNPHLKGAIEVLDLMIVYTFGRVFKRAFGQLNTICEEWLMITAGMLHVEGSLNVNEVEVLVVNEGMESLSFQLRKIPSGLFVINRIGVNLQAFNFQHQQQGCFEGICGCFYNLYASLFEAAGISKDEVVLGVSIATYSSISAIADTIEYNMSTSHALHILQQLAIAQELQGTSLANIPIDPQSGPGSVSCSIVALVALACLFDDAVTLNLGDLNSGILRLMFRFRNHYKFYEELNEDVWTLLLRLLYLEVGKDVTIALEHNNDQLLFYRTMLIKGIYRVGMFPSNHICRVQFRCGETIEFEAFARRLFRFINFRVNACLMDSNRFENYIRTRITTSPKPNPKPVETNITDAHEQEDEEGVVEEDCELFGFLEYCKTHITIPSLMPKSVKSELDPRFQVSVNFNIDYGLYSPVQLLFFETACDLCCLLRFCVSNRFVYQNATIDHYMYQLFVRLCSQNGNSGMGNPTFDAAMANVLSIYETDEWGQVVDRSELLQSFGFGANFNMDVNEKGKFKKVLDCNISPDSLNLSKGRFSKSFFYKVTTWTIETIVKWVPPTSASSALCRWAASLPIDATSRVRADKVAAARKMSTHLSLGILDTLAQGPVDMHDIPMLESLVSAANVCFVNVEFAHRAPTASVTTQEDFTECIEIKQEPEGEKAPDPERLIDEFTSNVAGICDETLDTLKTSILRAKRMAEIRLRQKRQALYKRQTIETIALIKSGFLFVHIVGYLIMRICQHLLDSKNGYTHKSPTASCNIADGTLIICCKGKKRALFNSALEFLNLAQNTISTITRACATVTFRFINGDHSQELGDTDEATRDENELIKFLKLLNSVQEEISREIKRVTLAKALHQLVTVEQTNGNLSDDDDLEGFVDFETDKHLSMITYEKPIKVCCLSACILYRNSKQLTSCVWLIYAANGSV